MKKLIIVLVVLFALSGIAIAAATDPFESHATSKQSPAESAFVITPSDTNELSYVTRAITCGTDGDLVVDMKNSGTQITISGRKAGIDYPYSVTKVYNSTTMTNCVGLY